MYIILCIIIYDIAHVRYNIFIALLLKLVFIWLKIITRVKSDSQFICFDRSFIDHDLWSLCHTHTQGLPPFYECIGFQGQRRSRLDDPLPILGD